MKHQTLESNLGISIAILIITSLIFLITYSCNQEDEEKPIESSPRVAKVEYPILDTAIFTTYELSKEKYLFFEIPEGGYMPSIDRINGKDLVVITEHSSIGKTWKRGEDPPFQGTNHNLVGFKLPDNYSGLNKNFKITAKKRN
jgi:hypothetical protein